MAQSKTNTFLPPFLIKAAQSAKRGSRALPWLFPAWKLTRTRAGLDAYCNSHNLPGKIVQSHETKAQGTVYTPSTSKSPLSIVAQHHHSTAQHSTASSTAEFNTRQGVWWKSSLDLHASRSSWQSGPTQSDLTSLCIDRPLGTRPERPTRPHILTTLGQAWRGLARFICGAKIPDPASVRRPSSSLTLSFSLSLICGSSRDLSHIIKFRRWRMERAG